MKSIHCSRPARAMLLAAAVFAALGVAPICRAGDQLPVALRQSPPVYPPDLRRANIEGEVVVEFIVDRNGEVAEAHVADRSKKAPWQFQYAAVVAVWQWRFQPGLKDGRPVNVRMSVPVVFSFNDDTPKPKPEDTKHMTWE